MDESTRLFCIRKTLIHMLIDRGYLVTASQRDETLEDFKAKFSETPIPRDRLTLLLRKKDDPTDQIFVFFPDQPKVGVAPIKSYIEKMSKGVDGTAISRAILVIQQDITSFAKQALAEMAPKYKVEQFKETELLVNITEHVLVPRHIRLNEKEKGALLKKYKLKESQLPRIQMNDPVARYYGLERGNVVKIIRVSETAGRYVTYRLVV